MACHANEETPKRDLCITRSHAQSAFAMDKKKTRFTLSYTTSIEIPEGCKLLIVIVTVQGRFEGKLQHGRRTHENKGGGGGVKIITLHL